MKFLIVGCGSIGKRHLKNLLYLGEKDLLAFDARADRRAEVHDQFGVPIAQTFDEALAAQPEAVLVCTPTSLHTEFALAAVGAGAHLFIEKPIAASLEGLDELLDTADRKKRAILVGCNFRFERGMRHLKALLDESAIGRALGGRVVFGQYLADWHPWEDYRQGYSARLELGGGILLDAIHEVDYIRWLLGPVHSVMCFSGKTSDLEVSVEDYADMLLHFDSGATAEVHVDYYQRAYQRSLEIYGTEGTLSWSFQDRLVRWFSARTKTWESFSWVQDPTWTVDEMYQAEMQHFVECVKGQSSPVLDGRDARRVLQIVLGAKESARTGRAVEL